ncbi:RHO1 GDP-GTP exchange protein 2, partial [Ceratobasidium sp. 370]
TSLRTVPKKAKSRKGIDVTRLVDNKGLEYKPKQPKAQLSAPVFSSLVAEVDSESETEMARRGLTSVFGDDFYKPGQWWVHSVPQEVVDSVSKTEEKRQEAINEVIYTERDFVRDLEYLRDAWLGPLETEGIIPANRRVDFVQPVFRDIEAIIDVNTRLQDLLTKRRRTYPIVETIGDIFLELVPHFAPFVRYGKHQLYGKHQFEKEKASNPTFAAFVETVKRLPESQELNEHLAIPITRLARYPLLLEVVLRYTPVDNVDRVAIPRVVKLVREFLHQVGMNRLNPVRLDKILVFRRGEEVDLKLKDEQRQLVYKGPLEQRGGAADENGDLQIFLFDHALLVAKGKLVNEDERLKVFRRPIPLELLAISTLEEDAARVSRPRTTLIRRNSNGSTANGTPPPAAPARPDSQKSGYQLTISHLGKRGYSLVLWAPTVVVQRKWVEHITAQQEVMRERSMVFDTFMLSEDVFVGDAKVNCAVPYDMGRRIAYGTDDGVYFQALGEGKNRTPVKVLDLVDVQQIDVLEEYQLLIVLSERSVLTFPLDALESPDPASSLKRMKRISSHTSFFKAGHYLGRTLVCVVKASPLSSTIKTFEPIDRGKSKLTLKELLQGKDTLKAFKDIYIPAESHSIHFLTTKLCVACTNGFKIVDLETLDIQVLPDPTDASLGFVQHRDNVRPLSIYRIDGEFLLCYTEFAFYMNGSGWRSKRGVTIYWEGTPTAFALHYPYVMAFDPTFIEIRHVEDGALVQVIRGNNLRCLFADTQPSVTNSSTSSLSPAYSSFSGYPVHQYNHPSGAGGPYSQHVQVAYNHPPPPYVTQPQMQPHRPWGLHERDEIILVSDDKVLAVRPAAPPLRTLDASTPKA